MTEGAEGAEGAEGDEEHTLEGVTVLEGNRRGVVLSLAFSTLCLVAGLLGIAKLGLPAGKDAGSLIGLIVLGVLGGGVAAWWNARVARRPSGLTGELRATPNGLYVRGERLIARRDIASAHLWQSTDAGASKRTDRCLVRIARKGILGGNVDLTVKDVGAGRALLHALRLDAGQSASDFSIFAMSVEHLKSRVRGTWLGGVVMITAMVSALVVGRSTNSPALAAALFACGVLFHMTMVLRLFKSTKVVVGADGVYLRWLWHSRFIATKDIVRAEVVESEPTAMNNILVKIRLHMRSGEPIDLVAQSKKASAFADVGGFNRFARIRAEVVAERINEAVMAKRSDARPATAWDASSLSRGQRLVAEWVASLRGLHSKVETFREEGGLIDKLWTVLEDAGADPSARAAAAVALTPHLDGPGRERLRIAAQATVAPKLRIALEAAADDDEDRLVSALDEVSPRRAAQADTASQ